MYVTTFFIIFIVLNILIWRTEEPPETLKSAIAPIVAIILAAALLALIVFFVLKILLSMQFDTIVYMCLYVAICFIIGYICAYLVPKVTKKE